MAIAVPTLRVDWSNSGAFTDAIDTVHPLDEPPLSFTRGRAGDFTTDAVGQLSFILDNTDNAYSFDRNWHDNPSFESDTTGYSVAAVASLTAAATSITKVVDNAPSAGVAAGEASLTATINSGVTYAYPVAYRFKSGVAYSCTVAMKSVSGNLNIRAGLASIGTPADIASTSVNITAAWVTYAFTWTPSADRTDGVFFVRTTTAAVAVVRFDAVQVNPGATVNAYLEAPTKGQLVPGRPVHLFATYSAVQYPLFFGYIERITPDLQNGTVAFTAYDVLRRMAEIDVNVPSASYITRSARDFRIEVLNEFERGTLNLVGNPSFETNTTGWGGSGTLTRITTDAAPGAGSACGQFVTTDASGQANYLIFLTPNPLPAQVYRISAYVKWVSGATTVDFGGQYNVVNSTRNYTLDGTWQRLTTTYTLPNATSALNTLQLVVILNSTGGAGTYLIDAVQVTRGQGLPPYADVGTGRWPNWCSNGSFDGGVLSGWYDLWTNLVSNPSFETDTTGWSVAGDAFTTAATSITRVVASPKYGTARADILPPANATSGAFYALPGTFAAGTTYDVTLSAYSVSGGTPTIKLGIGSQGTPADKAVSSSTILPGTYFDIKVAWTPSSSRTDAHLYVLVVDRGTGPTFTISIDGASVFRRDLSATTGPAYADTGPGGGGTWNTASQTSTSTVKYGSTSQSFTTPAATAGRVYDFFQNGTVFSVAQPYIISMWVNPSSSFPYKVGFAANKGDGTFEESTATGTAAANVWTQITATWTPSVQRSTLVKQWGMIAYVMQTDSIVRTVLIDGVRVIPGSVADNVEQAYWNIPALAESDLYLNGASLASTALAAMQTLNGLSLSRHWISATLATPFWTYNIQSRATYAAAASLETYTDGVTTAVQAINGSPELDRQAIVNVLPVVYNGGTEYYSDGPSVGSYGTRPGASIGNASFLPNRTIPDLVGPAYVSRYAQPIRRPTITVINRFPSQLQRDVNDMVTLTVAPWLVVALLGNIARLTTTIAKSGQEWTTVYQIEEKL